MAVKVDGRSKPRPGLDEQRRQLVDTAVRVFAERSASNVSISELCRAADISRPTFYRCFEDKDALLAWVYDQAVDRYVSQIDLWAVPEGQPTRRWIREIVDRVVDQVLSEPDLARFVFVEYGDPTSPVRELVNERFRHTATELADGLDRSGRPSPSALFLMAVFAAIQWILFETLLAGPTPERVEAAKQAAWETAMGLVRTAP
ncbi:MAG: TetR/AcrR family transcriptional regulator [Nitriliruptorales bacterium]|nr:TetR/AcrR family transcriptional regulator [Nitriliruptorales bacterium]